MLGRIIASDKRFARTKLVMMTCQGQIGDASRLRKVGFSAYLYKMEQWSELFDCLAAVLAEKKTTATTLLTRA